MAAFLSPLAPDQRLSFTRVQIDAKAAAKPSAGTRYSRTALPLALHTDTAHAKRPHSLVTFAMIRPDQEGGGRSIVATAADVVDKLSAQTVTILRKPQHEFGKGCMPILWGPAESPSIRYYRTQIDSCAAQGSHVAADALDELDEVLASLAESRIFDLLAGDILFINNLKALHARTGFCADSDRLMLRYRLRVQKLE